MGLERREGAGEREKASEDGRPDQASHGTQAPDWLFLVMLKPSHLQNARPALSLSFSL